MHQIIVNINRIEFQDHFVYIVCSTYSEKPRWAITASATSCWHFGSNHHEKVVFRFWIPWRISSVDANTYPEDVGQTRSSGWEVIKVAFPPVFPLGIFRLGLLQICMQFMMALHQIHQLFLRNGWMIKKSTFF